MNEYGSQNSPVVEIENGFGDGQIIRNIRSGCGHNEHSNVNGY